MFCRALGPVNKLTTLDCVFAALRDRPDFLMNQPSEATSRSRRKRCLTNALPHPCEKSTPPICPTQPMTMERRSQHGHVLRPICVQCPIVTLNTPVHINLGFSANAQSSGLRLLDPPKDQHEKRESYTLCAYSLCPLEGRSEKLQHPRAGRLAILPFILCRIKMYNIN